MGDYLLIPLFLFLLVTIASGIFIVKQQTAVLIETFGKFTSVRHSDIQFKIPFVQRIAARVGFIKEKVYEAFYKLEYPHDQITSYVFDVVRAEVPKMKLDDVFVKKDDIAIAVKAELQDAMINYGYDIIKTLVTDIDPDAH